MNIPQQVVDDPKFLNDFLKQVKENNKDILQPPEVVPNEPEEESPIGWNYLAGYFVITAALQPFNVTSLLLQVAYRSKKAEELTPAEQPVEEEPDEDVKFKSSLKQYEQYLQRFKNKRK
jgi:hypothetical protein